MKHSLPLCFWVSFHPLGGRSTSLLRHQCSPLRMEDWVPREITLFSTDSLHYHPETNLIPFLGRKAFLARYSGALQTANHIFELSQRFRDVRPHPPGPMVPLPSASVFSDPSVPHNDLFTDSSRRAIATTLLLSFVSARGEVVKCLA